MRKLQIGPNHFIKYSSYVYIVTTVLFLLTYTYDTAIGEMMIENFVNSIKFLMMIMDTSIMSRRSMQGILR